MRPGRSQRRCLLGVAVFCTIGCIFAWAVQEIATAEAAAVKLDMQAAAAHAEKAALEKQLEEVQLSCAAGQADLSALKRDLTALEAKARAE
jgi:hypothetical protein